MPSPYLERLHVAIDERSNEALAVIEAHLQETGQRGSRSDAVRYAAIKTARALAAEAA